MFKALLKKQFKELGMTYTSGGRGGSGSGAGRMRGGKWVLLIYPLCLFSLGMSFYAAAENFASILFPIDLQWLYFAYLGMMAVALGVFGSVFGVVSGIYKAKDNELLLSMPIPPAMIVMVRMITLWIIALVCVLTGLIPALIIYVKYYSVGAVQIVSWIIAALTLSFTAFALSCIVGWVVAIISRKLQNRSIITVLLALLLIAAYYVFYFNLNQLLARLMANAELISDKIKRTIYPLYVYGKGCSGEITSALIALALSMLLMGIIYLIISKSFVKVATSNKGTKKKAFSGRAGTEVSIPGTLLRKEFKRYLSSANYMLNCSMGTIFMTVAAVAMVIEADVIRRFIASLGVPMEFFARFLVLGLGYAVMFLSTMNDITAPSLSLEGKNYWILRSLPIDLKQVAKAKLKIHFLLTGIPMALVIGAAAYVFRLNVLDTLLFSLLPISFMMLMAYMGLAANIKFPRMDWVNETIAVKQGASVMITILGGIVLVMGLGALYFLVLIDKVDPTVFLLCLSGLFIAIALILRHWIMTKGVRVMESLPC